MNLTNLRRLVLAGNIAAFAAAGAAAWHAFQSRPAPRDEKEWPKLFPIKAAPPIEANDQYPPLTEYQAAISQWPQGEKPKPVSKEAEVEAPKIDPFKSKYRLNCVFVAEPREESYAQLALTAGNLPGFSVRLGERIPEEPTDRVNSRRTPWRLDGVTTAGPDGPGKATALFRNIETDEEVVLELQTGSPGGSPVMGGGSAAVPGGGGKIGVVSTAGRIDEKQPARLLKLSEDRAKGEAEFEMPEDEFDWVSEFGEKEVGRVSTVPFRDASGNPAGFVIKAVQNSRLADYGFKPEDRVVSVNGEKVNSTEQAVAVGKRQHEGGKSSFSIKFIRAGQERNYTFHAKKKKSGK